MKTIKYLFTTLLLLCVTMVSAHDFEVDGIYYNILSEDDKTVEVTYKGNNYDSYSNEYTGCVVIPESVTYNGTTYSVTIIGSRAFCGCNGLANIEIPNSVTDIQVCAFEGCISLKDLCIEDGTATLSLGYNDWEYDARGQGLFYDCPLETLYLGRNLSYDTSYKYGYSPFYNNETLTSVTIGNSVTSIGEYAFYGCSNLTNVEFGDCVTNIGEYAFYDCYSLTNVEIGNSVTNIGEYAFFGCSSLINVEVGSSVTNIGDAAFRGCSGLTSITVETGNTKYDSRDNCNAIIETQTNTLIAGCQNTIIPNSVTSIGKYSFYGCTSLTSIVIPNSITSIVNYAFYDCTGLKTVVNFSNLTFSKGKDSYGYIAFYANNVINTPNGFVENDFVWDCSNDKNALLCYLGDAIELTLPIDYNGENYVIGSSAFDGCSSLTSITIPNSVTSIESYAFKGCTSLKDLCIEDGDSILSLGHNLIGYTELYYSKTGEGLFYDCPLETLYLGRNLSYNTGNDYGYSPFYNKNTLTSVTIGNSVTSIEVNAFYGCTGLTSVVIPNSVTRIKGSAFSHCSGLTSIEIPNSVSSIRKDAFHLCDSLKIVYISDLAAWCNIDFFNANANPLTKSLFLNGELVTKLVIPEGVTEIKQYAFFGCDSLTKIEIPNSVTSIGERAFASCTGITSATIGNSVTNIGESAFNGCRIKTVINFSNLTFSKGSSNNGYVAYYADKVYNIPNGSIVDAFVFDKSNDINTLVGYLGDSTNLSFPTDYQGENYIIGANALKENKIITSIVIPNSATTIEEYAFSGCTSLKDVKIGDRAVSVERYAFSGCSSLENLRIGDGMKSIEEYAFYNCANLKEIVLGKRINYIGNNAFASSDKIESIYALPTRAINCENATTAFHQNACKYATLYVKESSIDSYETTEPWSKFYIEPIGDFTLTYMVDGEVYKKEKYEYDSEITPLDMPDIEGHTFIGWGGLPETMPAYDVTVTGYYNINNYNLTYMLDGEVYYATTVEYGAVVPEIEIPSKEGHSFSGWSKIPATMPAQDVVIEGSFVVNSYNLIYIVDGEEYKRESVAYGTAITLLEESTKEGHTFNGWSNVPKTMPAHDVTVTGSYSINSYNLTYMVDGEVYYTMVVEYGAAISEIEMPNKKGYTFSGWDSVPKVMPANDVVINGSFSVNSYMVFFMVDDAVYQMSTVKYEDKIELPSSPIKEGYIFSHWDGLPEIMPAENVVVYAVFDEDTAIDEVKGEGGKVKTIYDLNGRVVENPTTGIYIIDGKKVFVK